MMCIRSMSSSSRATTSEMRAAVRNSGNAGNYLILVPLIAWIHLFQSLQEVSPVGALLNGGPRLPLEKFLFARLVH